MKVILQQDVRGQGKKGQMIDAAEGYARNFLIPRKLAVLATPDAVNTMKRQEKARLAEEAANKAAAQEAAEKLKNCPVRVSAKAGAGGKLFGAVTNDAIATALKANAGIELDKRKIVISDPIKNVGTYTVQCKLGYEIVAPLTVKIEEM